ncbi:MAG: hypothetical protein ACR2NZ_18800, partial [Rubripirellula sp.]
RMMTRSGDLDCWPHHAPRCLCDFQQHGRKIFPRQSLAALSGIQTAITDAKVKPKPGYPSTRIIFKTLSIKELRDRGGVGLITFSR